MQITMNLDLNEVNVVLDALGTLPTSSNVWPLAAKIRNQAAVQMQAQAQQVSEPPKE